MNLYLNINRKFYKTGNFIKCLKEVSNGIKFLHSNSFAYSNHFKIQNIFYIVRKLLNQ